MQKKLFTKYLIIFGAYKRGQQARTKLNSGEVNVVKLTPTEVVVIV